MTLPLMTLAELRTAVRQRADMVNSQFVSDDELNSYINESLYELYDLLVTTYGQDYYVEHEDLTTDGTQLLDLPTDFYKLLGVDLQVAGSSVNQFITLLRFEWPTRNRNVLPNTTAAPGITTNLRYLLRGGKLWLTPTPASGQTVRLWYVPRMFPLEAPTSVTFASIDSGSFVEFLNDSTGAQIALLQAGTDFDIGTTDAETAENFAAAANGSDAANYLEFEVDGSSVTMTYLNPCIAEARQTVVVGLNSTGSTGITFSSTTVYAPTSSDGISGWLEYVIVDGAIKCLQKEESDTSVLERAKLMLIKRVNDSASNRDAANPPQVSDVSQTGNWFGSLPGDDGGFWGRGGWGW